MAGSIQPIVATKELRFGSIPLKTSSNDEAPCCCPKLVTGNRHSAMMAKLRRGLMKYVWLIVAVLLLAINACVLLKQRRLETQVATLQAENARLAQELVDRPAISPDQFREAQARLGQAEAFMDAVENRLTNATALLGSLQTAVSAQSNRMLPARRSSFPGTSASSSTPPDYVSFLSPEQPLQPSSSHTPDGQLQHRSWGPEQVVGPPDTNEGGDIPTAWAPLNSSGSGEEWLHVNYDKPVDMAQINVRETYNPGAISKVAAVMPDGSEVVVWQGTEPPAQAPVDMTFSVPPGVQAQSVKVYLDRSRVPGWNEIDAIELVGRDGSRQWASSAKASSSYAEPRATVADNSVPR